MKKIISLLILSITIYACGDSDSDNDKISLSDIHGLWNLENTQIYFFIDKDQGLIFYFTGDEDESCLIEGTREEFALSDGELFISFDYAFGDEIR